MRKERDEHLEQVPLTSGPIRFCVGAIKKWFACNLLITILYIMPSCFRQDNPQATAVIPVTATVHNGRYRVIPCHTRHECLDHGPLARAIRPSVDRMGDNAEIEVTITPSELIVYAAGQVTRFCIGKDILYTGQAYGVGACTFSAFEIKAFPMGILPTVLFKKSVTNVTFKGEEMIVSESNVCVGTFLFLISGLVESSNCIVCFSYVGCLSDLEGR